MRATRLPKIQAMVIVLSPFFERIDQAEPGFAIASSHTLATLRNVRNHLDADPTAQITVMTHAFGVDFLMEGMKDRNESAFDTTVSALKSRGVKFEACEITLKNRSLKKEQFIREADFTPSGVVRLTKLQLQGFAYIRP